jgi:hypothetical protein
MNRRLQKLIVFGVCIFGFLKLNGAFTLLADLYKVEFSGMYKPENFLGKNVSFFNNYDKADSIIYFRHTLDLGTDIVYGTQSYKDEMVHFHATVRNRAPWGTAEGIIKTTSSTFKVNEVVTGEHNHSLPRNIFWMRDVFVDLDLRSAFNLPFEQKQKITLGSFSYQLGRGIALGDAYAVGPDSIGFYSDSILDQFAYGLLISNELVKDKLVHEFYVALLQNKSGSLSDTNAKILGQEYGRLNNPKRQFGSANFVVAGSLKWNVFGTDQVYSLTTQPYWLLNRESEQYVEFPADASGMLGTIGLASEFGVRNFEFGFDCAVNMGRQQVKGWDRNQIITKNINGVPTIVNSSAWAGNPNDPSADATLLVYVPGSTTQAAVDQAFRSAAQNGLQIVGVEDGLTGASSVYNDNNRFRDPFFNVFNGYMAVADTAYWLRDHTVRIAGMVAIASGDEFPNFKPEDGNYSGFVGLQELYAGDRVKSAFFLGGAGKAKRPFSKPTFEEMPDVFQDVMVSGFSNLRVVGASGLWTPAVKHKKIKVHSNLLAYWQDYPTGSARPYLGAEGNLFFSCNLFDNVEFFTVASFFVPGSFYVDRKGVVALTSDELVDADQPDVTGYTADPIPGLNDHVAFTFNVGLKFSF